MHLRARYYDPAQGRFFQPDPWGGDVQRPQTLNGYAYVSNNPIRRVDPSGQAVCLGIYNSDTGTCHSLFPKSLRLSVPPQIANAMFFPSFTPADAVKAAALYCVLLAGHLSARLILEGPRNFDIPWLAASTRGKPLTHDEEILVERGTDRIDEFIREHPDLPDDVERVRRGETLPEGEDHIDEAESWIRALRRLMRHLNDVRENRTPEAQEEIDRALENAERRLRQLQDILGESTPPEDESE